MRWLAVSLLAGAAVLSGAASLPPTGPADAASPARPAVSMVYQGFGATTPGGAGRPVVRVTNLNDAGPGSLREALLKGKRTVVFDVAGEIPLTRRLLVKGAYVTIDGFTAPPPGITLRHHGLYLHGTKGAHHVIVRGLRIRDAANDGLQIKFGASNIVIVHVSVAGSRDGNLDITRDARDLTVAWSIFTAPQGTAHLHSKNVLIKYNASRITLHHNVLAKAAERNPQVRIDDAGTPATDTTIDMRNNVVWEWNGGYGTRIWYGPRANVVNNFYASESSAAKAQERALVVCDGSCQGGTRASAARAYVRGNLMGLASSRDINAAGSEPRAFPAPPVDTQDACTAARAVQAEAGARPLDTTDQRLLEAISLPPCGDGAKAAAHGN
jgi:hypothetical protein